MRLQVEEFVSWCQRNGCLAAVGYNEPILIGSGLEATDYFTPGEFSLTGKITINDTFMEGPSVGVVGCIAPVKRVMMFKEDDDYNRAICGERFDFEVTVFGPVDAEDVTLPSL
jgi:hypothetical protein